MGKLKIISIGVGMSALTAVSAFAAEDTTAITGAFTTAIGSIKGDVMSMIGVALPVGLGIVGVFLAVKLGIKFFKSVAK